MSKTKLIFTIYIFLFLALSRLFAQGISRSTGLGFRANFWKHDNPVKGINQLGGVSSEGGGSLYFFSRFKHRWFLETSIGGLGRSEVGGGTVESITLTPFLFGARYDFLSPKYASQYQPYLAFGTGDVLVFGIVVSSV